MKWSFLIFFANLSLLSLETTALPSHWKYRVLKTPHFEILYRQDQKALARRYAVASERAFDLLLPIFKEAPKNTIVVLKDNTDLANGMANFLPYASIVIYPVLPVDADTIDEYGDWPLELMIHEYAHILNLYPAHGFYWPFKWVLGSVVRPNAILPAWYLEGLAVNLESRYSQFGRLRSRESQAQARSFTLENRWNLEDISRINESSIAQWPFGGRPYLFGGWWWDEAIRKKGEEVIYLWNQQFSRRLPFLLNSPIREKIGLSAAELLSQSYETQRSRAEHEITRLRSQGVHDSVPITNEKSEQNAFAISPNGMQLVYWSGQFKKGNEIRLKVRDNRDQSFADAPSRRLFKGVGTIKVRWINESEILFDQINTLHPHTSYRDLYIHNLEKGTTERLTVNARAQDASASPSGSKIAFIQNEGGQTKLMVMERSAKKARSLINGRSSQRLASPEFLDENRLLFTVRQADGNQRIYSYDLVDRKTALWNEALRSVQSLRLTARGLLVTDATTGVRNAYLIEDGRAQAVTSTLTDIQKADFDPHQEKLVISELTAEGRRLKSVPLKIWQPASVAPVSLPTSRVSQVNQVTIEDRSFQPWRYMLPSYWIPFIYQVEEGFLFQGLTNMSDPIGRNQYSLSGSYDSVTKKGSYGLSYLNRSLPVDLTLAYAKSQTYLGASGFTVESDTASLNFGTHGPWNNIEHLWTLGALWSQAQSVRSYRRLGPQIHYAYSNYGSPSREWFRYNLSFGHEEYLQQSGYLDYGKTTGQAGGLIELAGDYRLSLQTRAAVAPDLQKSPRSQLLALGESTLGGNYLVNLANSTFLLRGYPSGSMTGRTLLNGNLELILPARQLAQGLGTLPLFFRDMELALFADAVTLDGVGFDPKNLSYLETKIGEFYMGTGAELRLNTSVAYHLPVSFTFGLYYGVNDRFGGGLTPFLGIGAGSLGSIENKTP